MQPLTACLCSHTDRSPPGYKCGHAQDSNHLTGSIPGMGSMAQMQTFNLRDNQLSGQLPEDWFSTHTLRVFDVSYNNLNGAKTAIPKPAAGLLNMARSSSALLTLRRDCSGTHGQHRGIWARK